MNQGRCLQNVIRRLAFHLAGRNTVKLRIDQAGGLFGGITVAMLHSVQQESELRWGAGRAFRLLAF